MKPFSPFNHQRDKALGKVLRELLTPDDHEAFVARVMSRVGGRGAGTNTDGWLEVLSAWAGPGLAAAAAITGLALFATLPTADAGQAVALEDTISQVPEQEELSTFLVSNEPPDLDFILASSAVGPAGR